MDYTDQYFLETEKISRLIDKAKIKEVINIIFRIREACGRLFILGVGGSAANASHAVNDFRKILNIECYTPVDNVAELTAWANDSGFENIFVNWLKTSRLSKVDAVLVLSVGGGTETTSKNLVLAMEYAKLVGASIVSIVGRDGGSALKLCDSCILIPVVEEKRITAHTEGWQGLLLHLVVGAIYELEQNRR